MAVIKDLSMKVKYFFIFALIVNVYAGSNIHKEFYISLSGSDKNNGSINSPFATGE
jgi:hypothetical protein